MTLYFKHKHMDYYVEARDDDYGPEWVSYCAQGGGFVYKTGRTEFDASFKPVPGLPGEYRRARFTGDWLGEDEYFEGYTNGQRWNGWACPMFPFEEAKRLAAMPPEEGVFPIEYDEQQDAFVIRANPELSLDEDEVFHWQVINTPDGPVKCYAIGSGWWCWYEWEPIESKDEDDDDC